MHTDVKKSGKSEIGDMDEMLDISSEQQTSSDGMDELVSPFLVFPYLSL